MKTAQDQKQEICPEEILEYLPLIANRTCPPDKREEVERDLGKNPTCQAELAQFEHLAQFVKAEGDAIPVPSGVLLEDIMDRIGARKEKLPSRFQKWLTSLGERLSAGFAPPYVRFAAVLAVLIIVLQFAVILHQSKRITAYHTLSGPAAVVPGRISVNIIFNPKAHLESIQAFLARHHGLIIRGPGASGVYIVSFPAPKDPEKLIEALKGKRDIIVFAEMKN